MGAKTQPAMTENPTTSHCPKAKDPKLALNGILPTNSASIGATAPPIGPSSALCNEELSKAISAYPLSFWQAFGLLGIPMLFLLLICIGWTAWLIGLTLKPNEAANLLMDTGGYDSGLFWLIVEDTTATKATNVAGLLAIECFYLYLLAKLLVWRAVEVPLVRNVSLIWSNWPLLRKRTARVGPASSISLRLRQTWMEVTGIHGKYRKFWNLLLKAVDLTVETIALYGFLSTGFPPLLVYTWAGFICANASSCALSILMSKHSALQEILVDSIFDLVAAVGYPLLILGYCHHNFSFDHKVYALYERVIRPNSFDNVGRLFADQSAMALFRLSFDSLRLRSPLGLFLCVSMNLSFCTRFRAVIHALVRIHCRVVYPRRPTSFRTRIVKAVPKLMALLFVTFGALVVVYTYVAIHTSWTACSPHPECVVYIHRFSWTTTTRGSCPCRTMIDENGYVAAWEQWTNPVDVTDKVKTLAAAGELHLLRLINRQLTVLPEELRGCPNLQHLSLIYTQTEELPDWVKDWSKLEYLHIEGQPGGPSLKSLPGDLFEDMPALTVICLSQHRGLESLPTLAGAPNLRSLVLASLPLLKELPSSFDKVPQVVQLVLFNLPQLERLPDMAPLVNLADFAVIKPSHICCNGFLSTCDQSDSFCVEDLAQNVPEATCLEAKDTANRATEATINVLRRFASSVCHQASFITGVGDPPTKERTEICGYSFFRRCEYPPNSGHFGMCMPYRMQVLSCTLNDDFIQFRHLQDTELGMPCNPIEEAWLGCTI